MNNLRLWSTVWAPRISLLTGCDAHRKIRADSVQTMTFIRSSSVLQRARLGTIICAYAGPWCVFAMTMQSAQKIAIENTHWSLTSVSEGALDAKHTSARLMLDSKEGRAFGFAGCNNFSAPYRLSRSALTFQRITSTRKGCVDADLAKVEDAYLAALKRVRSWRIQATTLSLRSAGGRTLLTFERAAE